MSTANCEICGGKIYEGQPAVKIQVGSFFPLFHRIKGHFAVAHADCLEHKKDSAGKVAKRLAEKLAKREEIE